MFSVEIKGLGEIWQMSGDAPGHSDFEPMYVVLSRAGDARLVEFVNAAGDRRPVKHFRLHAQGFFEWGYAGSGPADTARSILIALGNPDPNPALYQTFKHVCIARIPEAGGRVAVASIRFWLNAIGPDGTTATTVMPFLEELPAVSPDGAEPLNGSDPAGPTAGVPAPHPDLIAGMDHAEPATPAGGDNGA
jgi:hypothetical protein